MTLSVENIFAGLPQKSGQEQFVTLFRNGSIRIERIVSHSHSSPPGFWYDQPEDEWVIVLRGNAILEIDGGEFVGMNEGDYLVIPGGVRHRVHYTGAKTVWLTVHAAANQSVDAHGGNRS
jgi:cupin 2 domain-containing protein